jgi:acyl carrier protein
MDSIRESIRQFILDNCLPGEDPANLTDDLELKESGILDSMSTLKLVNHLEQAHQVELEASDLEPANLATVSAIERLIKSKKEG